MKSLLKNTLKHEGVSEEGVQRIVILNTNTIASLFLSEYDPRFIGLFYNLYLYQVLAVRYFLFKKNYKYDKLCYYAAAYRLKKETFKRLYHQDRSYLVVFKPFKHPFEIPKTIITRHDVHSIIKLKIYDS